MDTPCPITEPEDLLTQEKVDKTNADQNEQKTSQFFDEDFDSSMLSIDETKLTNNTGSPKQSQKPYNNAKNSAKKLLEMAENHFNRTRTNLARGNMEHYQAKLSYGYAKQEYNALHS